MENVAQGLLVLIGLIHLAPGIVAISIARTRSAYGVDVDDRDLEVLLRHRAVLLSLVGAALIAGALAPALRVPAIVAGAVSMVTFVVIALTTGGLNPQTRRVVRIDILALLMLAAVVALINL